MNEKCSSCEDLPIFNNGCVSCSGVRPKPIVTEAICKVCKKELSSSKVHLMCVITLELIDESKECWDYDQFVRKFIVCRNLHKEETEIEGYGGTCNKCDYMVVLPDELIDLAERLEK